MTRKALSASDFLEAEKLEPDAELTGAELTKAFWTVRGREKELARKERFWAATNDALASAYRELAERTAELQEARRTVEELNRALEERVSVQVEELVRRSKEISSLDVRLRERVVSRSEELAKTVQRLAHESSSSASPGQVLGDRVRLERLLATGGMGAVFAAKDLETDDAVAVKILLPSHEANAEIVRRFVQEAGATARIRHPAIVRTLHVDVTSEGRVYQVMELVRGLDLARYSENRTLESAEIAHVGVLVAEALAAAHASGVVHRDIKPSNVMLCGGDAPIRILDFGVSKVLASEASIVETRQFVGTAAYASPEQLEGRRVDSASDVYSLGIMLYELLTGARPTARWLNAFATPSERRDTGLPASLFAVISGCLSADPASRPSAAATAAALAHFVDPSAPPPWRDDIESRAC